MSKRVIYGKGLKRTKLVMLNEIWENEGEDSNKWRLAGLKREMLIDLWLDEIESEVFSEVIPKESDLQSDNSSKKVIQVKFFFLHIEYGKNDGDSTPWNLRVVSEQSSSEMVKIKNGYHLNIFHVNIDTVLIVLQHCTCGEKTMQNRK